MTTTVATPTATRERTEVRLVGSFSSGSMEWLDDSGTDSEALDRADVADLTFVTFGVQARRTFGPPVLPVRPFLTGGLFGHGVAQPSQEGAAVAARAL